MAVSSAISPTQPWVSPWDNPCRERITHKYRSPDQFFSSALEGRNSSQRQSVSARQERKLLQLRHHALGPKARCGSNEFDYDSTWAGPEGSISWGPKAIWWASAQIRSAGVNSFTYEMGRSIDSLWLRTPAGSGLNISGYVAS